MFRSEALIDEFFRAKFAFGDRIIEVERSGREPNKVFILLEKEFFGSNLRADSSTSRKYVSNGDWKRILGYEYFGIPRNSASTENDDKFRPTYRALVKYFLRLNVDGGSQHPNKSFGNQQTYSWQACLSFLLGLEWRIAKRFQEVREKEKTLGTLKRAAAGGVIGDVVGSVVVRFDQKW